MGLFDWLRGKPADEDKTAKTERWLHRQIVDANRAHNAIAIAEACAALSGAGAMAFGMVVGEVPGRDALRMEAIEALRELLPPLGDADAERVFEIAGRAELPVELAQTRARLAEEQQAALAGTLAELREALRDCDAVAMAEAWRVLGHDDTVLGVAVPERRTSRAALRELVVARMNELLPTLSDAECMQVFPRIRSSGIPLDIAARSAELAAKRRTGNVAANLVATGDEPRNDDLERALAVNPDDASTLAVLGDWLADRGHPRGELIALQLRAETDPSIEPAATRHLEAHAARLLGSLARHRQVGDGSDREAFIWRRGFIHHARLSREEDDATRDSVAEMLVQIAGHPSGRFLAGLDIGMNGEIDNTLDDVVETLAELQPPHLHSLFLGDVSGEQAMVSVYTIGNLAPLWSALPALRRLVVYGIGFELGAIELPNIEHVEIQTGGLSTVSAQAIAAAHWPKLQFLDIWYGDTGYGSNTTIVDVEAQLARGDLTELVHLGLKNAELTDEICARLAGSPLAPQLRELDLSMGTMTDAGAAALIAALPAFPKLVALDVSDNFLTPDGSEAVRAAFPAAVAEPQKDHESGNRFVSVGE